MASALGRGTRSLRTATTKRAKVLAVGPATTSAIFSKFGYPDTPCNERVEWEVCHHKEGCRLFFRSIPVLLIGMRIVILASHARQRKPRDRSHRYLDDKPMERDSHAIDMVKIFAARAAAELKRQKAEADCNRPWCGCRSLNRRTYLAGRSPNTIITSLRREEALPRDLQVFEDVTTFDCAGLALYDPRCEISASLPWKGHSGRRICPLASLIDVKETVWTSLGLQPASLRKDLETERQYTVEYGLYAAGNAGALRCSPQSGVELRSAVMGFGSRTPGAPYAPDDLLFFQEVA